MTTEREKNKNNDGGTQSFVLNKAEVNNTLTDLVLRKELLSAAQKYADELISLENNEAKIHVDELASGVAKFYEKVRKVIDWNDDNVLRRNAIERILKRKLFPKLVSGTFKEDYSYELAKTVTEELIRGGHLANHQIPKSRIDSVSNVLKKYLYTLNYTVKYYGITDLKKGNMLITFLIEIAACEIEEVLVRPVKEYGIIEAMARIMNERIKVIPEDTVDPETKLDLLRVSVQRKLYHLDRNYIVYMYLRRKYPNWRNFSREELEWFAQNIASIKETSEEYINSKIGKKFDEVIVQYSTVFVLFDDALESLRDNPETMVSAISDKNLLLSIMQKKYNDRRSTLKTRLKNSAIFSTLSVILTNFVTFFLIEVPLARLFYEGFNVVATLIDFILPACVMFLLIAFIKPPEEENAQRVLKAGERLLFEGSGNYEAIEVDMEEKGSVFSKLFVNGFFAFSTVILFAFVGFVFYIGQLPMTSVVYDTFTMAMTFYAALEVRRKSKELYVEEKRTFKDFMFDAFTVPLAKVGGFLSSKWREYNVAAIFTNYLVEVPFTAMLNFIELWGNFLKDRKSELD